MDPPSVRTILSVAALILSVAGCGEASGGPDPEASGSRSDQASELFLAGTGEMWVVDPEAAPVGDRLALWSYDVASVPTADPSAPPAVIAEDGWIFIPAADPDRIWVGFLDPGHPPTERPLGELREIDAEGNVITRDVEPPHGAWPYAELTDGLLFQGPGAIRLWDPDQERTVRSYRWQEIGDMGPVSGNLLASCLESCEELILTDFGAGEQLRIPAPEGLAFVAPEATFSPDGTTLAVPVKEAGGSWKSFSTYDRQLALVSLERGETEVVRGSVIPLATSSPPGRPTATRSS